MCVKTQERKTFYFESLGVRNNVCVSCGQLQVHAFERSLSHRFMVVNMCVMCAQDIAKHNYNGTTHSSCKHLYGGLTFVHIAKAYHMSWFFVWIIVGLFFPLQNIS